MKPLFLLALAAIPISVPIWWRPWRPSPAMLAAAAQQAGTQHLDVMLLRAGLSPSALAAAGVSASATTSLASAANTHVAASPTALSTADAAYASARPEVDRLRRLIESGKGSAEDVASFQSQSAHLATASAQQAAALNEIFTAATAGLSAAQRAKLSRLRTNASWQLPTEFLVVDRSQAEWVALRDALAGEKFAAEYHETLDASAQTLLATARAHADVAAARIGLDTNLVSVTSAWNAAAGD